MARLAYGLNTRQSNRSHFQADLKHQLADDEVDTVLDDSILERTTSGPAPHEIMGQQRDSFAADAPAMSPRDNRWSGFTFSSPSTAHLQAGSMTSPLFFEQDGQAYVPNEAMNSAMYTHPSAAAWHGSSDQDSCPPTTAYDVFPSEPDVKGMVPSYHNDSLNPQDHSVYVGLPLGQPPAFYGASTLPTSPRSGQEWSSVSSAEHVDLRSVQRQGPLSSPPYNPNPPLLRRDGIRKKNARFEIPAERTLRTIDTLINQTTDEQEIKELKQQKRLLRNRQAALDSRQRKKQHTERLEEEKKTTSTMISELEDALGEFKLREESWTHEREQLILFHQQQQQCIDELMAEKEDLVRHHTIETAELRKKNAYLADHAQKLDSIAMSAVPSSTGYSAEYSDFENLTMESSPWDNFSLATDFNPEPKNEADRSLVVVPKKESNDEKEGATGAASGLLLMILLCGAWVVSNNTSANSDPISRMPEEVRAASTAVLDTIYTDIGLQPQLSHPLGRTCNKAVRSEAVDLPSKTPAVDFKGSNRSRSPLAMLHGQLTSPSEQQQREQIFSLSTNHYNCVIADDDITGAAPVIPKRRRHLGDALAGLRLHKQGAAAEDYARSLMWNEIPANIARDFARMVAEAQQEGQEPLV
ncbi:MAG: hypothetical protein Q9219_002922 [cf. Caloplaca sp. 3 TL-2023]